jgi:hypothetical protein
MEQGPTKQQNLTHRHWPIPGLLERRANASLVGYGMHIPSVSAVPCACPAYIQIFHQLPVVLQCKMEVFQQINAAFASRESWLQAACFVVLTSYVFFHIMHTLTYTAVTYAVGLRVPASTDAKQIKEWDEEQQNIRRAGLYLNSFVHALLTALPAMYMLYHYGVLTASAAPTLLTADIENNGNGLADIAAVRLVASISCGYFAYDFVATAPDWYAHPEDFLHHLLGLLLVSCFFTSNRSPRLGQHLFILETSTIFLNLTWALKKLGKDKGPIYMALNLCFVLLFAAGRQFYLPYITYVSWMHLYDAYVVFDMHIGIALILLCILNTFWMYKILRMIRRMVFPKDIKTKKA